MKKFLKIISIILAFMFLTAGGLAFWQRQNIKALIVSTQYTNDELAEKIDENRKAVETIVETVVGEPVKDLTFEEEEQVRNGEITVEQAMESINASKPADAVGEQMSQMYQLKAYYISRLGELERQAKADYSALPKEKRNKSGQQDILSKYLSAGASLERECDAKVEGVLSILQAELKKQNRDLEVIKTVRKAYEDEKVLKKSYYLNTYK